MNKIFTIGAMGVALTSMEAKADLFKCTACPAGYRCDGTNKYQCSAGTYSHAGASNCSACGAGTYSNAGAGSCSSCGDNAIVNSTKTGCISITDPNAWTLVYNYSSGEGSATLSAGTYLVSLHGGNGGGNKVNSGKLGGTVTYKFTVDSSWTFKYGVGQNAKSFPTIQCQTTGGGGGSWISINNQYIVAGGGGGIVGCDYMQDAGTGGAVGSGSSSVNTSRSDCAFCNAGGDSGNYKGGTYCASSFSEDGNDGYDYDSCYIGQGINNSSFGHCYMAGFIRDIVLYPGFTNLEVGGDAGQAGSATHTSNINIPSLACGTSAGCVKLYKLKN